MQLSLENEIQMKLLSAGADFVYFVDISQLSSEQNKNYPVAILIGILLSANYICEFAVIEEEDEFCKKESKADKLADYISDYLMQKGYGAYSQSENSIYSTGFYNETTKETPLPHKTIAVLAGLGWIGKSNLLVTTEYGSALCMCTVLTDAPLHTSIQNFSGGGCNLCTVCKDICPNQAIKGNYWNRNGSRDDLVDVFHCSCCLQCLMFCPWTQAYKNRK